MGGCSKELVIKLESDRRDKPTETDGAVAEEQDDDDEWRERAQEQLIETYAEKIVSGHAIGCLWRRRGCDGTIYISLVGFGVALTII